MKRIIVTMTGITHEDFKVYRDTLLDYTRSTENFWLLNDVFDKDQADFLIEYDSDSSAVVPTPQIGSYGLNDVSIRKSK